MAWVAAPPSLAAACISEPVLQYDIAWKKLSPDCTGPLLLGDADIVAAVYVVSA
jgi:hypothetical protein